MTRIRKLAFAALAAPLALGLAACDSSPDASGLSGDPIDPIAAPEGTSWLETVTVSDMDGYVLGNPDAPIKLIEYASLTCGGCANFVATGLEPLKSEYVSSGRVSFELRNLVRDPIDLTLATLARCGENDLAFHGRSDAWWTNFNANMGRAQQNIQAVQAASDTQSPDRLVRIAQAAGILEYFSGLGLPEDQAQQCLMDSAEVDRIANNSVTQANDLDVQATPTFFLNGSRVEGSSWSDVEAALQRAGAR